MRKLGIFADESGSRNNSSCYYLSMLVFHDQTDNIMTELEIYKEY